MITRNHSIMANLPSSLVIGQLAIDRGCGAHATCVAGIQHRKALSSFAMCRLLGVVLLVAGCYQPRVPIGLACSDHGSCPNGQTCGAGAGPPPGPVERSGGG